MLLQFFYQLKRAGLPVSIGEWLSLMASLKAEVTAGQADHPPRAWLPLDDVYYLARITLVKNEAHFDRFDRVFGTFFQGMENVDAKTWQALLQQNIPEAWLHRNQARPFSEEEMNPERSLGWEELMKQFNERLAEQKEAHHGGSKWIGTGGTSPFGHSGQHPEGIRVGGQSRNRSAVKVWQAREYRNLDDTVEMGTRNLKVALRRLRQFARAGAEEELDLPNTIRNTANNAGYLQLAMQKMRHNTVKVLLLMDVGGSMDDYVRLCEQMFSACKSEFKHLESFYFHNCVYDHVWRDNLRRNERMGVWELIHKYGRDYRLIFVGDASMSPYEITQPHGAVESVNDEAGAVWLQRLLQHFERAVWINPEPKKYWQQIPSTRMIHTLMEARMFPLTPAGIGEAVKNLQQPHAQSAKTAAPPETPFAHPH